MNILQFFHKKETLPPFFVGDKVRLRHDPLTILPLYNREYPNCSLTTEQFIDIAWKNLKNKLGYGVHIVTKITEGTSAAGGWFVYVDNQHTGYHGNIFEKVQTNKIK